MNGADIERDIETLLKAKRLIKREEQTCAIRDGKHSLLGAFALVFFVSTGQAAVPQGHLNRKSRR